MRESIQEQESPLLKGSVLSKEFFHPIQISEKSNMDRYMETDS